MFRLIESRRARQRSRGAATISVLAHTAIIIAAVATTARSETLPEAVTDPGPIIFVAPGPPTPQPAGPSTPPTTDRPAPAPALPAPIDVPIGIAIGDPVTLPTDPGPYTSPIGAPGSPGGHGGPVIGDSTAFGVEAVDRPVTPKGAGRTPRYPELMRRERREGSVLAYFVVDTAGRVEPGSFRAASTTHSLFTLAVESAVLGQRFTPAEVRGKRVRQLVQQRFVFELNR